MGLPPCLRTRSRRRRGRRRPPAGSVPRANRQTMAVSRPSPSGARIGRALANCCARRSHDDCATATGWPGKRRPIAPLAVPLARPYRAVRPCRSAGTLSAPRVSRRIGAALRCVRQCMRAARLRSRGGRRARRATDEWAGCERGCWRIARPFGNRDGRGRRPVPIEHWHTLWAPSLPAASHGRQVRGARSVRWSTARRRAPFAPTRSCHKDRCALCLPAPASARARRHTPLTRLTSAIPPPGG